MDHAKDSERHHCVDHVRPGDVCTVRTIPPLALSTRSPACSQALGADFCSRSGLWGCGLPRPRVEEPSGPLPLSPARGLPPAGGGTLRPPPPPPPLCWRGKIPARGTHGLAGAGREVLFSAFFGCRDTISTFCSADGGMRHPLHGPEGRRHLPGSEIAFFSTFVSPGGRAKGAAVEATEDQEVTGKEGRAEPPRSSGRSCRRHRVRFLLRSQMCVQGEGNGPLAHQAGLC